MLLDWVPFLLCFALSIRSLLVCYTHVFSCTSNVALDYITHAHRYISVLYFQMRSVGPLGVPVWGEAVQNDFIESPPPQITKIEHQHELDLENKEVEVVVMLEWELQEPIEAPPTDVPVQPKPEPMSSSMVPTVTLPIPLPTPSSSPVDLGTRRRRQLPDEESGSRLRELTFTGIFIYMGMTRLKPFEPRPTKNVQEVEVLTMCMYYEHPINVSIVQLSVLPY